jgi:hypothetical protein
MQPISRFPYWQEQSRYYPIVLISFSSGQILQGAIDPIVPPTQSEEMVRIVQQHGGKLDKSFSRVRVTDGGVPRQYRERWKKS